MRIITNLKNMLKSDLPCDVTIRIHVSQDNFDGLEQWLEHIAETFLHDNRFHLFLKFVGRLGGKNNDAINVVTDPQNVATFPLWKDKYERKGAEPDTKVCYASQANSFVVRANGRIAKCTVKLDNEANDIGYLDEHGALHITSEKIRYWMRGFNDMNPSTLMCPAFSPS